MDLTVNNTTILAPVLDNLDIKYEIISPTSARLFTKIKVTPLVLELAKVGCEIVSINQHEQSLADYFLDITGRVK